MLATEQILEKTTGWREETRTNAYPGGLPVTVREVQNSDIVLIQEMHERLSMESVYYRYLGSTKPSAKDLQRLCASNGQHGLVLVATVEELCEKVVGIACYQVDPNNPSTAEPAVLVEDSFQGCGLGKQIMSALCQRAIQNGLETFDTFIHPTNRRVFCLIKSSGLDYESRYNDGLREIRVWLKSTD